MTGVAPIRVVVIGAGGHAKVVIEAIRAARWAEIVGVLDPAPPTPFVLGVPVIGNDDDLVRLRSEGLVAAVIALGDNALRLRVGSRLQALAFHLPPVIHPASYLAPSARVATGSVVMAQALIGTDAEVDDFAIINTGAIVDHDGRIGRAAHIAPGSCLAGNVVVGERALVGVGSSIRPGVRVGEGAVIGAGSAVVQDVPVNARVGGAPARALRDRRS